MTKLIGKYCAKCRQYKRLSDYNWTNGKHTTRKGVCKECENDARRKRRIKRTCKDCVNYDRPCFPGIENMSCDFASEGCHNYKPKQKAS